MQTSRRKSGDAYLTCTLAKCYNQKYGRPCISGNGRPYSILKEDQLLDIIRKFQEVLIETVKIRFEQPILNDSILLEL